MLLLFYWLVAFQRVQEDDPIVTKSITKYKVIFFLCFLIVVMAFNVSIQFNLAKSPSLSVYNSYSTGIVVMLVFTILFIVGYAIWIFVSMVFAFKSFNGSKMERQKTLFFIHFCSLFTMLSMTGIGVFRKNYTNGGVCLFFISYINFYIFYLVIMHWPVADNEGHWLKS
jgi:hypothetical protein